MYCLDNVKDYEGGFESIFCTLIEWNGKQEEEEEESMKAGRCLER